MTENKTDLDSDIFCDLVLKPSLCVPAIGKVVHYCGVRYRCVQKDEVVMGEKGIGIILMLEEADDLLAD